MIRIIRTGTQEVKQAPARMAMLPKEDRKVLSSSRAEYFFPSLFHLLSYVIPSLFPVFLVLSSLLN